MRSYQVLTHTADIRLKLVGSSLGDLFAAGVEGLALILKPGTCHKVQYNEKLTISLSASDATKLLIDFLSEVLTLSYTQKALFCRTTFLQLTETKLSATLEGVSVEGFAEDVKAVTYHEADVVKNEKGDYETVVVLDI